MHGAIGTGHGTARRGAIDCAATDLAVRAAALGLTLADSVDLGGTGMADIPAEAVRRGRFARSRGPEAVAYVAPRPEAMPELAALLAAEPGARSRVRIATPAAIREGLMRAGARNFVREAVASLARRHPAFSASRVLTATQAILGIAVIAGIAAGFALAPRGTLSAAILLVSALFFGVTLLRIVAAGLVDRRHPRGAKRPLPADGGLPVYTVLVPVRDEAAMLPDLIAGLRRLDWPADRLDIKLLIEADDAATLAAAERLLPGPPFELVIVPVARPRTKPKALAYALPFARGELVTIYDAEDRPHPGQLREAWRRFAAEGPDLACLQAPIVVDNENRGWLARMFAIEYAALFDGLLPALEKLGLPLPLGGTSNHFRRAAVDRVGGWDPFNVTEDADLGIRLARFGYRTGTLLLPTLEEAPVTLRTWLNQRTRWMKGWMQTVLVHNRNPVRLWRELGPAGFAGFQLTSAGVVASALIHPAYLLAIFLAAVDPTRLTGDGTVESAIIAIGAFNLVAAFLAMTWLSARSLARRGRRSLAIACLTLPFYWPLVSLAAYRALWQLAVKPHFWGKTPHERRGRFIGRPCPPVAALRPGSVSGAGIAGATIGTPTRAAGTRGTGMMKRTSRMRMDGDRAGNRAP